MASFIREADSALTPLEHSRNIFHEYLKMMFLKGMFGKKGSGKPIIIDDTLTAKKGESVRFHFVPQNKTDGVIGQDTTLEGNEDSLDEYYVDVTVDQLRKGFRKKGKMTDQRVIFNIRDEFKTQLANWFAQTSENYLMWALTGIMDGMTITYTDTTDLVTGTNRCIRANGIGSAVVTAANSDNTALAATMATSDKMSTRLIEDAVIMAKEESPYKRG